MQRSATRDEEDELLQQAIRDSLLDNQQRRQQQERPPPYGWNIPSETGNVDNSGQQQQRNNLYPDLPSSSSYSSTTPKHTSPPAYRVQPTAPPADDLEDVPFQHNQSPTPTSNSNAPYPSPDSYGEVGGRRPLRTGDTINVGRDREPSLNDVRSARLRRFENKNS